MKQSLKILIQTAINTLQQQNVLPQDLSISIQLEQTRDPQHGDYACNIAMLLAKAARAKPADIAKQIVDVLPGSPFVERVVIAGPGFINFFLTPAAFQTIIPEVLSKKDQYGQSNLGKGEKLHLEFVSSNPTGPLHVGHGRGAAYGASLGNLLEASGYKVHREYYVNDAGRQMDILATSLWLRYLSFCGEDINSVREYNLSLDTYGYKGEYLKLIAKQLYDQETVIANEVKQSIFTISKNGLLRSQASSQRQTTTLATDDTIISRIFKNLPPTNDKTLETWPDEFIDSVISTAKELLGTDKFREILNFVLNYILSDIKQDLVEFGVHFDTWFSEYSLFEHDGIKHAIEKLKQNNYLFEQNGALWFRSTDFGDDKDRVVVRDNGQPTYFASDLAYMFNKHKRGFKHCILVLGADHHSYVTRIKAAAQALGFKPNHLEIPMVQFAVLYRGAERVQMSTRSGEFVTLRELRNEVSNDAARFFYVMRKCEQHLDFDLELAKSKSNENPVYYIQYAHARICSVERQLQEKKLTWEPAAADLTLLTNTHEKALMVHLRNYPEMIEIAAANREPHMIAHYLRELASDFHAYYNAHSFLVEEAPLRNARLNLIFATRHLFFNGLKLLGVSAPEAM